MGNVPKTVHQAVVQLVCEKGLLAIIQQQMEQLIPKIGFVCAAIPFGWSKGVCFKESTHICVLPR
jgi:hypothetical protein